MASLICFGITSLDGYVNDESGSFDWSRPDEQVHRYVNNVVRSVGTFLYGRRMYEVMRAWDGEEILDGAPDYIREFAELWRATDKVVYSATLPTPTAENTRLEYPLDIDEIRRMKSDAASDISIAGPTIAAEVARAGLVDEWVQLVSPVIVGGGTPFYPAHAHLQLDLVDERRFRNGVVALRYRALS